MVFKLISRWKWHLRNVLAKSDRQLERICGIEEIEILDKASEK